MQSDEQAIRDTHERWIAAVDGRDLAHLLASMTEDVVFMNPGRPPFGRDEFQQAFRAGHAQNHLHCTSELREVVVAGDMAYTVCHDALSVKPRDGGASVALAGDRITIYRRQSDGRWLLARDAHTLSPVES